MIAEAPQTRAEARPEATAYPGGLRLFVVRLLNYLTNHVVSHVPSYHFRHAWYARVLGITLAEDATIQLGCYVCFFGLRQVRRDGVSVGAHSRINRNCCLDARGPIRIGDNVSISPEVMILTAAHRIDSRDFRGQTRPVVIEDHVYIGSRATILPGVTLGRGSVVGAGAVVTRDVAPLTIVVGVPARPVGARPPEAITYVLDGPLPLFE